MDHQACQLSSRCRRCHREGRRCSCSIHLWSGPGHDRSHRPIKENHISNEVPAPILQNYPLTTTTANDTITNHPRHPKLITLSLCVAKYAGGSSIPISSQAETDDGPWPSIARHGRHRICRRYDTNGEHCPATRLLVFIQSNGSLCIAEYAGGSRIHPHRPRPRPTMALGPPSPATDGTEYVGDTILTAKIRPATRLPAFIQPNGS